VSDETTNSVSISPGAPCGGGAVRVRISTGMFSSSQ
jgi:hypothetical protein